MILKEKKFKSQTDPMLKAGDEAEKKMAFYLQRAFGKTKDIFVLNDLRIIHENDVAQIDHLLVAPVAPVDENDVAQIDHLLVTRYGLFIIESKSVHGTVAFNKHGEWMRVFGNGDKQGMPSPIKQAEEQGKVLRSFLTNNREKLLGKMLFGMKQKRFSYCPIRVRVAISDTGVIERGRDEPNVQKAQVIADSVTEELKKLKFAGSPLALFSTDIPWEMEFEEAKKVVNALFIAHRPLPQENIVEKSVADASQPIPAAIVLNSPSSPVELPALKEGDSCPKCKSGVLGHKDGRDGQTDFLGCSNYFKSHCKFTLSLPSNRRAS